MQNSQDRLGVFVPCPANNSYILQNLITFTFGYEEKRKNRGKGLEKRNDR